MKQTVDYVTKFSIDIPFGYYYKSGLFAQYVTKRHYNHYSDTYWKIHINYPFYAEEAIKKEFLINILGYLQKKDISHKIVLFEKDILRMNRPASDNTQNGKIITIYCNSEEECFQTMDDLNRLIVNMGIQKYPLAMEQNFRNDQLFKGNPYIGYRYASMPRRPFYVVPVDEYGEEVEDIQEKYLSKYGMNVY